jgi:hypothetical protein
MLALVTRRHLIISAAACAAAATIAAPVAFARADGSSVSRGPSTTVDPYVIPVADGVHIRSLFTVDDRTASNGYDMGGIPDGLGAFPGPGRTFSLFMNHELGADQGVPRRHGQKGSYVARLQIDPRTGEIRSGRDLMNPGVRYYDHPTGEYVAAPTTPGDRAELGRFCSGTLVQPGGLLDERTGRGYDGGMWFANEETGDTGRTLAVTEDGAVQELPRLGRHSTENTKPALDTGARTVTVGTEDGGSGQLWVYAGAKQRRGNEFDRAGLTNGVLSVIRVAERRNGARVATDAQFRATYGKGRPAPVDLTQVNWEQPGAAMNTEAAAKGLSLTRIEDAAWDPRHPDDLYFVTTSGGDKTNPPGTDPDDAVRDGGGVWRLALDDRAHPELGGTLTLLLDGSEAPYLNMPDNVEVDRQGNVLLQEDPGGNPHVARILSYQIRTGRLAVVAQFDPALFAPATPGGKDAELTTDEESSGIIDAANVLSRGWYAFDAQVHSPSPNPAHAEKGQLLVMRVADWGSVYR